MVWVTDQSWVMIDTTVRVLTQSAEVGSRVDHLLESFHPTTGVADPSRTFRIAAEPDATAVYQNDARLASYQGEDDALRYLMVEVNRAAIRQSPWFAVHPGVVQHGESIIAFPAVSDGGKTTLTSACLLRGFEYLTDEALIINDSGAVVPYPRPLALSPWSCEKLGLEPGIGERLYTPRDLDADIGTGGPPTDVVIPSYGTGDMVLEKIARSAAVEALLTRSFNHYKNAERAFRLSTELARRVNVWHLVLGDPLETASLLYDRLG